MTLPAITTDGRPIVGAYGDVYTAPAGTPAPTDLDTPGTPWVKLGLVSEDGATWTLPTEETTDIGSWQTLYPVRRLTTSLDTSIAFALMEWDRDTLPFALGGGEFTDAAEIVTFTPPGPGESVSKALFVYVKDGDIEFGIYYPSGRVMERGDSTFKSDEAALLNITFGIEVTDINADPYLLLFKTAAFPAASLFAGGQQANVQDARAEVRDRAESEPSREGRSPRPTQFPA